MLADPKDQQRLLTLAELDAEYGRLQHAARSLPEHASIAERMKDRQVIVEDLTRAETRVDDYSIAVKRAEADVVPVQSRLEREEKRVADGSVTDAKVLRGLTEEVERIKRRIEELEEAELEAMALLEAATVERDDLAARKAALEERIRADVLMRDKKVAGLSAEAKGVAANRAAEAAQVPEALLKLYEKIRAHSGLGAAKLHQGRCGGCQLQITVADLDTYRKAAPNEVLRCVECDRILVRTMDSGL